MACSAATQVAVGAWSMAASQPASWHRPSRHSMQTAPWPTAGSISSSGTGVPTWARPSRFRPARASTVASTIAGVALGEPRVDVAAQVDDLQVGPAMQELGASAQRRGADDGALPQVGDALDVARDQHVARILARQEGGDDEARRLRRRHVLHAVHRGVDAAREQRLLDLLDEQALAAGLGQRPVLDDVARGPDRRRSRWRRVPPAPAPRRPARRAPGRPGSARACCRACRVAGGEPPWRCSSVGRTADARRHACACWESKRAATKRPSPSSRRRQRRPRQWSLGRILANVVYSQLTEHRRFGGVVPEIAARAHLERIDGLVEDALTRPGSISPTSTASPPPAGPA